MSGSASPLTVREVAAVFDVPQSRVRRIVDSFDPPVARAGLYRLIPRDALATIAAQLGERRSRERKSG